MEPHVPVCHHFERRILPKNVVDRFGRCRAHTQGRLETVAHERRTLCRHHRWVVGHHFRQGNRLELAEAEAERKEQAFFKDAADEGIEMGEAAFAKDRCAGWPELAPSVSSPLRGP